MVDPDTLDVGEGDTATFTVALSTQPAADVTVGVASDDPGAASVSTASLTFTADTWNTAQTVTVTAVEDPGAADETATITLDPDSADDGDGDGTGPCSSETAVNVSVAVDDRRRRRPRRSRPGHAGRPRRAGWTPPPFTVALSTQPAADVQRVGVASDDPGVVVGRPPRR